MKHRKYGGSTASRTIACPAWHQQSEGIPRQTSVFARIGTALHSCMEEIVLEDKWPEDFTGLTVDGVEITSDLTQNKLVPALEAFNQLTEHFNVIDFEPEVECSYAEDIGGYADMILRGGDTVIVLDWKFGDGILVDPTRSPQGLFYGMAARKESSASDLFEGATRFVFAIIQPTDRADTLSFWEADIEVLDTFEKQHARAVKEAQSAHPPIASGDHCAFCPAASVCPQKTGAALRALQMQPDDLDTLSESMELVGELKSWIKAVERTVFEQLNAGCTIDGWKLVQKRALAKWRDEDAVLKAFRRQLGGIKGMTKTTLLSPAQLAKVAKAKGKEIDFEDFIVRSSTGTTLAPEDDKRPAVLSSEALSAALASIK